MLTSWCNGKLSAQIACDDRSVLFGDSCFSTIAIRDGQAELWQRHRERLEMTVQRLRFPVVDFLLLEQEVAQACAGIARGILRVTLTRGSGGRGYALPGHADPLRLLLRRDWPADVEPRARDGVELRWCDTRLARQPLLAGLKHGNRLEQVLARAEWQDAQIAEGLMCDDQGHVIEGTTSNLFFRNRQGEWCTPDLQHCGVAGVMRAEILSRLALHGKTVREQAFRPEALMEASEVFVCNAVIGIWPVVALAAQRWAIGADSVWLQEQILRRPVAGASA